MAGYNYFAVEGPIGVGKTILVNALAKRIGAKVIESPAEENPFLESFYRDPKHYAFSLQVYFLLSRYRLLTALFEMDLFHQSAVSDFVFERDGLFARLLLTEAEFRLYRQVEQHLRKDIPQPQLVILLQTPIEMLVRNVMKKGRAFERKYITEEFLTQLSVEYTNFFFNWKQTPLLIVDAGSVDIENQDKVDELVNYIFSTPIKGTQYYSSSGWL